MTERLAIITGISGQDGTCLSQLLRDKGYHVFGLYRGRRTTCNPSPSTQITEIEGDVVNRRVMDDLISTVLSEHCRIGSKHPIELYHLAAESHVKQSFDDPTRTINSNVNGALNVLEAVRSCDSTARPLFRIYLAGSSEMFGHATETPQHENTPFEPYSPYGISKVCGFELGKYYRRVCGMFVSNGILYNHESEYRPVTFVTRKITQYAAKVKAVQVSEDLAQSAIEPLRVGSLDAQRDWGSAKDYVMSMWLMLQHHTPDDFVVATGMTHTVRQLVEQVFDCIGVSLTWNGIGGLEKGCLAGTKKVLVEVDPQHYRPVESSSILCGNHSKAIETLGWSATRTLRNVLAEMVDYDLNLLPTEFARSSELP